MSAWLEPGPHIATPKAILYPMQHTIFGVTRRCGRTPAALALGRTRMGLCVATTLYLTGPYAGPAACPAAPLAGGVRLGPIVGRDRARLCVRWPDGERNTRIGASQTSERRGVSSPVRYHTRPIEVRRDETGF